jgi:hypothetical protein
MRVEIGMKRHAKKEDRTRALLRRANTMASTTHNIAGRPKEKGGAKPVTLPKITFRDSKD